MSKVKIEGNASGTGTLTISAPNTNTDRSLTLPDTAGEFVTADASGYVGIGTTSPSRGLHVEASDNTSSSLRLSNTAVSGGNYWDFIPKYNETTLMIKNNDTERMRIDSDGNLKFNSGYGSVATAYGVRVWACIDQINASVDASGNVSSVTDRGNGQMTANFSITLPDANYSASMWGEDGGGENDTRQIGASSGGMATTSLAFYTYQNDGGTFGYNEYNKVCLTIVR